MFFTMVFNEGPATSMADLLDARAPYCAFPAKRAVPILPSCKGFMEKRTGEQAGVESNA
jgi:hypothetical protein